MVGNAAHNAVQAARGGPGDQPPGTDDADGVDASWHTPEWHAARIAAMSGPRRETLDEFKQRQAREEAALHAASSEQNAAEQEYRRAMEEERNRRLGLVPASRDKKRDKKDKKEKKKKKHKKEKKEDKDKRKRKSGDGRGGADKKRRRHRSDSDSSDSSLEGKRARKP